MLYPLHKSFKLSKLECLRINIRESKFSPNYPRNAAVQWIKIDLPKKANPAKLSCIYKYQVW